MLNSVLCNRQITRKNKLLIYNSIVLSHMELKHEKKHLESKFMSMEMDFLRGLARCSRLEEIRNNVIREKNIVKNSVLDYIRYKQLNWYDHGQRMDQERNGAHLEDEERLDLEIRGFRRLQQELK